MRDEEAVAGRFRQVTPVTADAHLASDRRKRAPLPSEDAVSHARLRPRLERGAEPPGRARRAPPRASGRGCPRRRRRLDRPHRRRGARARRAGRLVRRESRAAGRDRRRLRVRRRARLRLLRPGRRGRTASAVRAPPAARKGRGRRVRRGGRLAVRLRRGVRGRALRADARPAVRDRRSSGAR